MAAGEDSIGDSLAGKGAFMAPMALKGLEATGSLREGRWPDLRSSMVSPEIAEASCAKMS